MMINFILIGRRVKEFRTMNLMSQAELSEQIDMSVPYISLIETGTKHASLATLVRIANTLGVTVDTLINGEQTNEPTEYLLKFAHLISDCNDNEVRVVYELAFAAKKSLRQHYHLQIHSNIK